MDTVHKQDKKRKILSLVKERDVLSQGNKLAPEYINSKQCFYMVWREGGDMPKRLYSCDEQYLAISHAKRLTALTGERFHVLRSWRAYEQMA